MGQVEFDFQAAKMQEQALEELSSKMERLTDGAYEEFLLQIHESWDGFGADKFLVKAEQMREQLAHTSGKIRQSAELLREAGIKAEQMEKKANEIAKER